MRNTIRLARLLSVCVVIVLLAGLLSACGGGGAQPAKEMPKIKLGVQPWLGYGPWWIAEEKGYFKDHGLEVEVVDFTWDQDMTAALASGKLDVESVATNALIAMVNQGVDAQAFLLLDASSEADAILAPKDVTSVKDLKGKQVAFEAGSTSELLLSYALNDAGMTMADVETVPMAAADAGAALIAGKVDVAVTYEPYISAALRDQDKYGVLYTAAEKPGLISDVMIAKREFIKENPAVFEALALAWGDAINFLRDNPDDGGKIIADAVGSPMDEFKVAFEGVQVFDLAENKQQLEGPFLETFTTVGEIMKGINPDEIKEVPDPKTIITAEFVQEKGK